MDEIIDNLIDNVMGVDKRNEIFTLWYEITYLRMVISKIIPQDMQDKINFEEIKKDAQEVVRKRFPKALLNFDDVKL